MLAALAHDHETRVIDSWPCRASLASRGWSHVLVAYRRRCVAFIRAGGLPAQGCACVRVRCTARCMRGGPGPGPSRLGPRSRLHSARARSPAVLALPTRQAGRQPRCGWSAAAARWIGSASAAAFLSCGGGRRRRRHLSGIRNRPPLSRDGIYLGS